MKRLLSRFNAVVLTLTLLSVTGFGAITEKTLRVEGLTCRGCSVSVEHALMKIDGVLKVKAKDGPKGTVWVKYDDQKVDLSKIRQVIADTGFQTVDK
jgi:copper chaperone